MTGQLGLEVLLSVTLVSHAHALPPIPSTIEANKGSRRFKATLKI